MSLTSPHLFLLTRLVSGAPGMLKKRDEGFSLRTENGPVVVLKLLLLTANTLSGRLHVFLETLKEAP